MYELSRLAAIEQLRQKAHAALAPEELSAALGSIKPGDTITIVYGDAYGGGEPPWPSTAVVRVERLDDRDSISWPHLPGAAMGGLRNDVGITWVPGTRPEAVAVLVETAKALAALNKAES